MAQVELPTHEAQGVVDQREGEDGGEEPEVEVPQVGGQLAGVGEEGEADEGEDGEDGGDEQPPAEVLEGAALRRRRRARQAAASRAPGAADPSGYCSNRRIHFEVFL